MSLICFSIQSCEDPIDVTLNEAEDLIVVDAWLTNSSGEQVVKLTLTQPYFDNTFANGITNANVVVTRNDGTEFEFIHAGEGRYIYTLDINETFGETGDSFELTVNIDNKVLSSSTQLFRVPPIDSITQEFRENEVFADDGIYCQFFSRDIDGLGDTYWIKSFKNDMFLNRATELNIAFDAGFDSGGEVDSLVFITPIRELVNEVSEDGLPIPWNAGEKLKVEIHSISNEAFAFLEITRDQLLNSQNGIFATPLANTRGNVASNIDGEEILGIFNIAQVSSAEYIIE